MKVDFFLSLSLMNLDALRARLHPRQALNGVIIRKIHFYFALRQCDQIGRFKISFWQKNYYKSGPNIWWLFGPFWKTSIWCKSCYWLHIKQLLSKIWQPFTPTSGHTASHTFLKMQVLLFSYSFCVGLSQSLSLSEWKRYDMSGPMNILLLCSCCFGLSLYASASV